MPTRLHTFDLALIAVYLIGITLFGLRFRKSGKDSSLKSYFLANNTIPWWAICLSIVSAETSTLTIISIPGVAFAGDFGFLQIVIGYMLGRIVVAALFLPKYFQGQMLTAYQLIDQRFGATLHKVTAGLFLLTRAAAEGVRVFAVSIVVGIAIGTNDTLSIAIITILTLLYTFEGGMAAVIWTDVVQMAIYIGGTLVAVVTLGSHVPGGWPHIHAVAADAGKFHLFNFAFNLTQSYTFWAGVLGGTFLTMASHGTDQLMVQRMLAARNLTESRLALLSSGVVIFLQFTLFLFIGAGLYVFYGTHPTIFKTNDHIFPTFIVQQMPIGIAGLLIAAILAAAMSNLSAALNSLSSTTVVDFYMHWRPQADARERMLISRSSTVLWAIVLFWIAVYSVHAGGKGHVVETGLSIASVAYGCLLGVFLLGTLTRYATQTGSIIGMLCGFILNVALWQFPDRVLYQGDIMNCKDGIAFCDPPAITIPHIAFTWYVIIGAIVTFAIGSLASLIFRKQSTNKAVATATSIIGILLLCFQSSLAQRNNLVILSEAKNPRISLLQLPVLASRYPKASALGLSNSTPEAGLQPLGYALLSSPSGSQSESSKPDFTPISTLINNAIAAHKLPGAVVVIGHADKVVFEQAYGVRKLAGEPGLDGKPSAAEPMTEDTIFDMASLTKVLVTATAVMQLYEAGKLQFDDPVAKYLPDFAANGKEKVTIRELLTHYSGLPPDVDLKDPWAFKEEGIRRALASSLDSTPGTKFVYSDINFITLGVLVEKLSGEPLDDYAKLHIFTPLAMNETSYAAVYCSCSNPKPPPYGTSDPEYDFYLKNLHRLVCTRNLCTSPLSNVLARVAPTVHEDEGAPTTNPNFDHLLRGTVHDPTTRRMGGVAGHAGLFSTAGDASRFCDALLAKLLYNHGPFPLKQSTLQLMTRPEQPATAQSGATAFTAGGQPSKGIAAHGFGWDINTGYSRPRGAIFPTTRLDGTVIPGIPPSFGHTGFTGTSLWIDPTSDTYVILLANAIHPRGNPPISALRGEVATAAAKALGLDQSAPNQSHSSVIPAQVVTPIAGPSFTIGTTPTLTGIDVLESTHYSTLATLAASHNHSLKLGLLTNQTGLDSHNHRTIDLLHTEAPKSVPGLALIALFSPEHGILGARDDFHVGNETDPATHLPVISLYGPRDSDKHPAHDALKDLDAVVIDLQDAGVRFYTYDTVVGYFLEAAATERDQYRHPLEIIVLDRPNPIGGDKVQGPVSDPDRTSYTAYMPLPIRTGLTIGELARYINGERRLPSRTSANILAPLGVPLTVVPMQNWTRSQYFDDTHLPWHNPSPNLRSLAASVLYPGVGLFDYTNVSVGRGTDKPFEHIGACWSKKNPCPPEDQLDGTKLAAYLTARHIPGVTFAPTTFAVAEDSNHYPGHGQTLNGIVITADSNARKVLDSPELGIELLSALHHLYPTQFDLAKAGSLIASVNTIQSLTNNEDPRAIAAAWTAELNDFKKRRQPYLLYP